jgi:hypothetical protein
MKMSQFFGRIVLFRVFPYLHSHWDHFYPLFQESPPTSRKCTPACSSPKILCACFVYLSFTTYCLLLHYFTLYRYIVPKTGKMFEIFNQFNEKRNISMAYLHGFLLKCSLSICKVSLTFWERTCGVLPKFNVFDYKVLKCRVSIAILLVFQWKLI